MKYQTIVLIELARKQQKAIENFKKGLQLYAKIKAKENNAGQSI